MTKYFFKITGIFCVFCLLICGCKIRTKTEKIAREALYLVPEVPKVYNSIIIKQYENLDVSYSSGRFEIDEDQKIYEFEIIFDNKLSLNSEKVFLGNLVQKNYLLACDNEDCAYKIIPLTNDVAEENVTLISIFKDVMFEGMGESSNVGEILPGKSRHKILTIVPKDIEITHFRFLDRKIDIN